MRDAKRLDDFYDKINILHQKYFPDWRFGQLCNNFFRWLMQEKGIDLFFPEEDDMLRYFEEFCDGS